MKDSSTPGPSGGLPNCSKWSLPVAACLILLVSLGGIVALGIVRDRDLGTPAPFSHRIFYFLFEQHERPFLLVLAAFAALALFVAVRPGLAVPARLGRLTGPWPSWLVAVLAGATLGITMLGTKAVFRSTALTMDELAPEFQARIFETNRFEARVPEEWAPYGDALSPNGVSYQPSDRTWRSRYLPGYAAIRALFMKAGLPSAANPVLAALTVLGVAATASRMWPGESRAIPLAVGLLLTSSQFLVNSMSFYSMPAHLCLNVWWLYLFLRADRFGLFLAPWLGALALLQHNPVNHAVFAAPFLVGLVLSRRIGWSAYFAAVYAGAITLVFLWYRTSSQMSQVGDYVGIFSGPPANGTLIQVMNVALLFSWQSPLLALVFLLGAVGIRRIRSVEGALLLGLLLAFAVHAVFPSHQGHGWGYRYIYGVLGNVVLLGVSGGLALAGKADGAALRTLATTGFVIAIGFHLPLRALQTSSSSTSPRAGMPRTSFETTPSSGRFPGSSPSIA
jgi:hypothetical protein